MDKKQKELLQLVERIARTKVNQETKSRWPGCLGILHQPKRPMKKDA